jgi:hypothetical protein
VREHVEPRGVVEELPEPRSGRVFAALLVCVIGPVAFVAAVCIVKLHATREREHQKQTMGALRTIATAWEARATDRNTFTVGHKHAERPFARVVEWDGSRRVSADEVERALAPTYVKVFPRTDGWGHPFEFIATDATYGIRSRGSDGRADAGRYVHGTIRTYEEDIVWDTGSFVRFPDGL